MFPLAEAQLQYSAKIPVAKGEIHANEVAKCKARNWWRRIIDSRRSLSTLTIVSENR
jgi:hypothetical protein